ncbi:hypothetical protein SAMN05216345_12233 [Cupriavidus sp. YR651]|uniref:hypothetical protein n=1 Tax=Cupriavidus sp. YR651 TaxID=1855315 RepID=UPI00088CC4FE|nr:hypothetical protein [Cupriavidus sp. YR651]SDD93558.1 hypothetical protein SAMN05216345_12233 [Cupriavidus sp. YR651]
MCQPQQPSQPITVDGQHVRVLRRRLVHAGVALLLCLALCRTHAIWYAWLAAMRDLQPDDGAPARDIGRAVSLARGLRCRHEISTDGWLAVLRLACQDLLTRLANAIRHASLRPRMHSSMATQLVPLLPLAVLLDWLR